MLTMCSLFAVAQPICDQTGNIAIYSCYDGGQFTINVDQNIPNLMIGICSYEFVKVTITGAFASNVTKVWFAGYNGNNNHCNLQSPYTSSITGVPNSVDSILVYPSVTLNDPNGDAGMVCSYSCSNGSQGGCNTTNQVVHYFVTKFNGTMRYHLTQYGCFTGTYNVSSGGNCCLSPFPPTSINDLNSSEISFDVFPNPVKANITVKTTETENQTITIVNTLGEVVLKLSNSLSINVIDLSAFNTGVYFIEVRNKNGLSTKKIIKE